MKLTELAPAPGSVTESKRKGRGAGSGNGKTAGLRSCSYYTPKRAQNQQQRLRNMP